MPEPPHSFSSQTSKLNTLLSQYDCLRSLCQHLSDADIVHLAATCTQNRTCIVSSKPIFDFLRSNAICDGRGIEARRKLFAHKLTDDSMFCLGADAQPCTRCGAKVCDNCRFHFIYYRKMMGTEEEEIFAQLVEDQLFQSIDHNGSPPVKSIPIESKRAFDAYWTHSHTQVFCEECHPLTTPWMNEYQTCKCNLYNRFVGERRLCLPCFFVEETEVYRHRPTRVIAHDPEQTITGCFLDPRPGYVAVDLCDCGNMAMEDSNHFCRPCHKATGWYGSMEHIILEKIRAQLG